MIWLRTRRALAGALAVAVAVALPAGVGRATVEPEYVFQKPMGPQELQEQVKVTQEQALAILQKSGLPIWTEGDGVEFNFFLNQWPGGPVWNFNAYNYRAGKGSQSALVDAITGRIRQFETYGGPAPAPTGPQDSAGPTEEARQKANAVLRKLVDEVTLRTLVPLPTDRATGASWQELYNMASERNGYTFVWEQQHNGHPVAGSQVVLGLDRETLDVTFFQMSSANIVKFGSNVADITAEQALAFWQENGAPRLVYLPVYQQQKVINGRPVPSFKLVYQFENANLPVSAYTGRFLTRGHMPGVYRESLPVPEGTEEPVQPAALPLTEEAAIALAATFLGVEADSLQANSNGEIYHIQGENLSVDFDKKTGRLISAWRMMEEPMMMEKGMGMGGTTMVIPMPEMKKVDAEQAKKAREAAIALVQRFMSPLRTQLRIASNPENAIMYGSDGLHFRFERYVNGIKAGHDGVNVTINPNTLQWQSVYTEWADGAEFPSAAGVMPPDKAAALYFQNREPQLVYAALPPESWSPEQGEPTAMEAQLVYQLWPDMGAMLDARTGAAVGWDGQTMQNQREVLAKLRGHWAEGELRFVFHRGVVEGVLDPEGTISRFAALRWLMIAHHYRPFYRGESEVPYSDLEKDSPAYLVVHNAIAQGILPPVSAGTAFRPDDAITRAEFAVWTAQVLQLGELARSKVEVRHRFADMAGLTAEEQNAATFLQEVGVLAPGSAFRGSDSLTQAEAAALVVRLYNRMLPW